MKNRILHNFWLKIITLFTSFVIWQLTVGVADPIVTETFKDVAVTIVNDEVVTDKGKVYQVVDGNNTVTVAIKGKTSIVRSINKKQLVATANFEEIELASLIPVKVEVLGNEGHLIEATAVPHNIIVNIEDSASKKFPLTPTANGEVAEGRVLGDLTVDTDTINVSGPASVVNTIAKVEARVNVSGLDDDTEIDSELVYYDANNLTIDQILLNNELSEPVKVSVEVLDIKMIQLNFIVNETVKDGHEIVDVSFEPSEVLFYGKDKVLNSYDSLNIKGEALDIGTKTGKVELVVDLKEYLPEGLYLYDETANSVAVTIQVDKYGTKSIEIPVQSITVHNNPVDLTLEYDAITDVMLTFTGQDNILKNLSGDDIRLSIDLATYDKSGDYNVDVNVIMIEGCELIKKVTVPIKLRDKE